MWQLLLALSSFLLAYENVTPAANPQPGTGHCSSLSFDEITHNLFTLRLRTGAAARMANTAESVGGKASHQRAWEATSQPAPALALAPFSSTGAVMSCCEILIPLIKPALLGTSVSYQPALPQH